MHEESESRKQESERSADHRDGDRAMSDGTQELDVWRVAETALKWTYLNCTVYDSKIPYDWNMNTVRLIQFRHAFER